VCERISVANIEITTHNITGVVKIKDYDMGGAYSTDGRYEKFIQNSSKTRTEEITRCWCEDNIEMHLKEVGCENADWIHVT
jgi:hypothetical protein